jgi:hypothetical protein
MVLQMTKKNLLALKIDYNSRKPKCNLKLRVLNNILMHQVKHPDPKLAKIML